MILCPHPHTATCLTSSVSCPKAEFCPMPSIELYSCQDEAGIPLLMGESFGRNSKCFEFEMTTTAQIQPNAFCLNLECNQEAYKVHVLVSVLIPSTSVI